MRSEEGEGESGIQQAAGNERTVRKPHRRCHQQASAHRPAPRAVRGESGEESKAQISHAHTRTHTHTGSAPPPLHSFSTHTHTRQVS